MKSGDSIKKSSSPVHLWPWVYILIIALSSSNIVLAQDTVGAPPDEQEIVKLLLYPAEATVFVGETALFRVVACYADGTEMIVDNIEFTAESAGTFPVSAEYAGRTASAKVVALKRKQVIEVVLSPDQAILQLGQSTEFRLDAVYENGDVAYIKRIHYISREQGTFDVTAEYGGKTDTAHVLVLPPKEISGIFLEPTEQNAESGALITFKLMAEYQDSSPAYIKDISFIAGDSPGRQAVSYTLLGKTATGVIIVGPEKEAAGVAEKIEPPEETDPGFSSAGSRTLSGAAEDPGFSSAGGETHPGSGYKQ